MKIKRVRILLTMFACAEEDSYIVLARIMMEIKEADKIVIDKPIAWRPGFSNSKSFLELLANAVNTSPPADISETTAATIRPKTVWLKSMGNCDSADVLGSAACNPSNQVPNSNVTSNVVYKPIAKLVSKATVSLLANLGDYAISTRREIAEFGAHLQPSNEVMYQTDPTSDFHQNFLTQSERKRNTILENSEDGKKSLLLPNNGDRPSSDGHNWRKYGQKQVKGSTYPRSYYKCTQPNCPVKKMVERTLDGQIAEVVYKGEHNHSKPQFLKHPTTDGQVQISACDATRNEVKNPSWNDQQAERIEGHEGESENQNTIDSSAESTFLGVSPLINDPIMAVTLNASVSTLNDSFGLSGECEEVSDTVYAEADGFKRKRGKRGNQSQKAGTVGEATLKPRVVVQNMNSDSEIIGDGFCWRKYGQKVVKGVTINAPAPSAMCGSMLKERPKIQPLSLQHMRVDTTMECCLKAQFQRQTNHETQTRHVN